MSSFARIPAAGLHPHTTPANLEFMHLRPFTLAALLFATQGLSAQMPPMPGMDEPAPASAAPASGMSMAMHAHTLVERVEGHSGSGTSVEPNSTPAPMLMGMHGKWMWMLHGVAFVNDIQQSGPRGGDKLFSTNWAMPMAQRELGRGKLTVRGMFSLEPATVTGQRYPLLFQQGETAYGRAIVDGQHPHDFFMELAGLYDVKLGERTLLSVYAAPVGDPAMGPAAFPHRASAAENPVASLGHHQEDSTHIAADVVTVGVTHGVVRVEASGFHGREPDEHRWNIDQGAIDSWSTRLTLQPGQNWSGQYSYGRIHSPEALSSGEDQERMTASAMYNRPLSGDGNWASTVLWGRTRASDGAVENSYLLESTLTRSKDAVWTRMENAGRTSELLAGGGSGLVERPLTHVQAYSFGYDHEVAGLRHLSVALGGQISAYGVGRPLQAAYGEHPVGGVVFLRLRVR